MDSNGNETGCVPFLKWAGGKRWLVNQCWHIIPTEYKTYIEPFVGSGAMFFAIQPLRAILSDLNLELIRTYRAIRNDWQTVAMALSRHHRSHSADYYYRVRSSIPADLNQRAARFVYLNRVCWNGLYRVNKQGEFNVPVGTKTKVCLPTDDFERIHQLLRRARLLRSDFEQVIGMANSGDLVFADPPYTTLHNVNGFIKYNEKLFSWSDQVRLRDSLVRAQRRGAYVIGTNADHAGVRNLYAKDFLVQCLRRPSVIAANSKHRRMTKELLITTREVKIT